MEGTRMVCLCCNDDDVGNPERHAAGKKHREKLVGHTERMRRGKVLPPAGDPLNLSEAMQAAASLRQRTQEKKRRRAEEHHASRREGLDGL